MDLQQRLLAFREQQRKAIREYDAILAELGEDGLIQENEALKRMIGEYREELIHTREQLKEVRRENDYLKAALHEQILDEKRNILGISRRKLEIYFRDEADRTRDVLTKLEEQTKKQLRRLWEAALLKLGEESLEFRRRLDQLEGELQETIRRRELEVKEVADEVINGALTQLDRLAVEDVSPEEMGQRIRQNQLEMKVGLNLVNWLGILLILLGVGAAFNYSFQNWFSPAVKAAFFFLLGGLFLGGGEWMYRKGRRIFSQGLLGGGVSILYGAIFYSYFGLNKLIGFEAGLVLSVLVTAITVGLSLRYDSPVVCGLGLVGGFLPFLTYAGALGMTGHACLAAMGYLFFLNLAVLAISFVKQWNRIGILSFLLHMPALVFLVFGVEQPWWGFFYALLTFLMYLGVVLAYPLVHKTPLNLAEIVLLALNIAVNSIISYLLIEQAGLDSYHGLLTLLYCLLYLGMGRWIKLALPQEKTVKTLFFVTSLAFAILAVPFQFGIKWLSMGWLVESVLLIIFGRRQGVKMLEWAGWGLNLLCLWIFGAYEYLPQIANLVQIPFFALKFTAVIAGQILVLLFYAREFQTNPLWCNAGALFKLFKFGVILGFWFYLNYMVLSGVEHFIPTHAYGGIFSRSAFALVTYGLGAALAGWKLLHDEMVEVFVIFLYLVADVACVVQNLCFPVLPAGGALPGLVGWLALALLVAFNLVAFLNVRYLVLQFIDRQNLNPELYPLVLGLYLLGNLTAILGAQFRLSPANLWYSVAFLVLAIAFIVYGFTRRFVDIRRFGLALVFLALAKLFLCDLAFVGALGRIGAYFGFGLALLLISFIYQKVKSGLEARGDNQSA